MKNTNIVNDNKLKHQLIAKILK